MDTADDPDALSFEQRVHAEHRELARLLERTRAGLGRGGDAHAAGEAFARLRDEFEAHLAQEEQLYFPTIWALRPEHKSALLGFISAHDRFRRLIESIEEHLDQGRNEEVTAALNALARDFVGHERSEEQLLRRVTAELSAHPD